MRYAVRTQAYIIIGCAGLTSLDFPLFVYPTSQATSAADLSVGWTGQARRSEFTKVSTVGGPTSKLNPAVFRDDGGDYT